MDGYLLGVDNGSTISKAALFTCAGEELGTAARKVDVVEAHPGWSERDMDAVWNGTAAAIRQLLQHTGVEAADIRCLACTGHGNGLYLVDAAGRPVRPAVNSTDSRAQTYVDRWRDAGVDREVLPRTAQCLWPGQPNALLAWLRDHEPESIRRAAHVLMCKDYVRFRLTGQIRAELTDMSGTSLMNVITGDYDEQVLECFGIPEMQRLLPSLVGSADLCGEVSAEAAAATGLKPGTPVAGGMFDIDACALASGLVDERQMSLVAGTWGNNQYVAAEPLIDSDLFMTSCYSIPGYYLMLEGSPTSASNLEWLVTRFFGEERRRAEAAGHSVFDLCNELVESVVADAASPVFLPFLYGSNMTPGAKACLVGLEGRHGRAHVVRAVYEGIVFGHNTHLQRLLQFRASPEVIRFTGGAARSRCWVQIFADCFQLPIEIPAGTELGALGAAIAAAVAVGCYPDYPSAIAAMARIARRQEPDPALADVYQEKYQRYQATEAALAGLW